MATNLPVDSDRAWDGLVYYKKGTFVSRYEPYWGVVRRESSRGLQRIDLFKTMSAVYPTSDLFIPLNDVLHVLNREARAKKYSFQILATGCKYHLASETAEDRERWVKGLKLLLFGPPQPGIVYEHQVMVIPNSHSEKLQLSGRYILRITDSHIALFTSTGTLPTRFLYSLSHVARTRYTNFTDSGQKFSVVVIYCLNHEDGDVENGSNSLVEDEGMFVFQTQSASSMSQTIEFRAREISRKDIPKTTGSFSAIATHHSMPILERDPADPTTSSPTKPRPAPRQTRRSIPNTASPTHSADPMKQKRAPIPLPRHKKLSLDSSTSASVHGGSNGQPPAVKPRLYPRMKSRSSIDEESSNGLSRENSNTSPHDEEISVALNSTIADSIHGHTHTSPTTNSLTGENHIADNNLEATNKTTTDVTYHSPFSRRGNESFAIEHGDVPTEEKAEEGSQQRQSQEEMDNTDDENLPSLDDFLAQILQRRRESRDVNEACDNEKNDDTSSFLNCRANRKSLGQSGRTQTGTQITPYYYNLPPLLRSRGLTVDEEEEEGGQEKTGDEMETRSKRDTIGVKEYRSEWLRKGSSVRVWGILDGDRDSSEGEDHYLQILPALTVPADTGDTRETDDVPTSADSERPDCGSPLWGPHRVTSPQNSTPSPLTKQDPTTENVPENSPGKKKRLGSRRKIRKQSTLSRRVSATDLELSTLSRRRSSKRNRNRKSSTAAKNDPLPSLPSLSFDVDSDYEWAEIGEVLSDTGSDYLYSNPIEFSSAAFDFNPRRSASCSEFDQSMPEYISIQERPPAPLPLRFQDPVIINNPAHMEKPLDSSSKRKTLEEKRSTFQRARHCINSENSESSESQDSEFDYDYAAIPNRSAATLFPGKTGEYVDINRNSPGHTLPASSSSSPNHNKGPAVPPRQRPRPPPRPSLPVTDV